MKKQFKLLLALALALAAVLAVGIGAALAPEDSLLTLNYLTEKFIPTAREHGDQAVEQKLQGAYDDWKKSLDQVQTDLNAALGREAGVLYSTALSPADWHEGQKLTLTTGCGFLMQEGVAKVSHNGAVIDVGEGTEVPSGSLLQDNHRYLVGEDTLAQVEVLSGEARLGLQGEYTHTEGKEKHMPFYDVSTLDWFYQPVSFVYDKGYFSGVGEHEFGGSTVMTRAMVMTVFYRMAGSPQAEMERAAEVTFRDVPEDAWFAPYVKWAFAQGITSGTSETTFSPDDKINREQFVQMLYSFSTKRLGLTLDSRADLESFQDQAEISDWAREAVSWAVSEQILGSVSPDKPVLRTKGNSDRVAVAVMLLTFSDRVLGG